MDLSKAVDSLPHDLIVKKFKEYGADERTANIIEDYFSDRQRVKIAGEYSSWNYISRGIAQGSILGPLIFNILINDLLFIVKDVNSLATQTTRKFSLLIMTIERLRVL